MACCPSGQTCSGAIGGAAGYQSTTYYQPTTTYYQPTTTYYTPATTYYQATTTADYYGNGEYCSTIVEVGPNLPTTAAGDCGTILIVAKAMATRTELHWPTLAVLMVGLQALGGFLLARR